MLEAIVSHLRVWKQRRHFEVLRRRGLKIGKNTSIEDGAFLDPSHCFLISIGSHCTLAPCVRILAHDASTNGPLGITRIAAVTIEDYCFLGDSTVVLPGVTIGAHSIVGACSVVTKDIPPYSVAAGNPAHVICSIDEFLAKHQLAQAEGNIFPARDYGIESITVERKQEVLTCVKTRAGYLQGSSLRR